MQIFWRTHEKENTSRNIFNSLGSICCTKRVVAYRITHRNPCFVIVFMSRSEEQWCHDFHAVLPIDGRRHFFCTTWGEMDKRFPVMDSQSNLRTSNAYNEETLWNLTPFRCIESADRSGWATKRCSKPNMETKYSPRFRLYNLVMLRLLHACALEKVPRRITCY